MCTDLLIAVPEAKVAVVARSMEFASKLPSTVKYQAAGQEFKSIGKSWTIKHNYVSIDVTLGPISFATDGLNDKGFSVGALWFAGFAYYQPSHHDENSVNYAHAVDYLLANYTLVKDVLQDINSGQLNLWGSELESQVAPLHFPIHDATGVSGILEFTKDQVPLAKINYSNVCTNSPGIDWHLLNLGCYASLTSSADQIQVGPNPKTDTYPRSGMGNGLRGIPGDSFPASRFVKSYYKLKFALANRDASTPVSAAEAVNIGVHLMNSVDIVKGESQDFLTAKDKEEHKTPGFDYTQGLL